MSEQGPWFVRVIHNKVSVGIFACFTDELADLVDEACDATACEYKLLPSGGFIFGGEIVVHEADPEDESDQPVYTDGYLTDHMMDEAYSGRGRWKPVALRVSNDD